LNPLVGASEASVRGFFESLQRLSSRYQMVYVVWDEFESLFRTRGKRYSSTIVDDTLVPTFLSEVDGLQKSALDNVWLVAISNRPDLLDGAITREGRLGQKVAFTTLNEPGAEQVAAVHLRGRLLAEHLDLQVAAERMAAYAYHGPEGQGLPVASVRLYDGRREHVTSRQVLTGAMLKGSIDRGAERAWWRYQNGGSRGIELGDLYSGLEQAAAAIPLARENLGEYLGWPEDECARVVEVARTPLRR
jgi:SpoVK/Ycf46/Vps4 family AAA+-type ATPase